MFSHGFAGGFQDVGIGVKLRNRHKGIILEGQCLHIGSECIKVGLELNLADEIANCLLLFLYDEVVEVFIEEGVGGGSGEGGKEDGLDYVVFYEV